MAIHFRKVRWKNFLSTGNVFTEVALDKNQNTLVIGSNGAGKSTILDALCFGLYGKPFRKVKKDQLINSINGRDTVVEIEFEVSGESYLVRRGIKPAVFEIYKSDKMMDQLAASRDQQEMLERTILRMNMKSFTQIVILGSSSFVPFMQLPTSVRREVIEDLLDIRVFSTMSSLLKDRVSANKSELTLVDREISSIEEMIRIQKSRDEYDEQVKIDTIERIQTNIETLHQRIETLNAMIDALQAKIDLEKVDLIDEVMLREKMTKLRELEKTLSQKRSKALKMIEFYETNDSCPTCSQTIGEALKVEKINSKKTTAGEVEQALDKLSGNITSLGETLLTAKTQNEKIQSLNKQIAHVNTDIAADNREIRTLQRQIADLMKPRPVVDTDGIEDLRLKLKATNERRIEHMTQKELLEVATVILRDSGIKSRIIKQYIPIINSLVNKYLAMMDFFVKFELDESFEERLLSRHRDDFTYDSFSEGEKMRIDLALLFTWRAIAKMKNSASTNLLLLDEVFDASLDNNGCDDFMKLLQSIDNTNTFIISHKGEVLQDKFKDIIRFEKHKNFSRIVGVSEV
jgi:DNA repair exonuclease SbcCD ATPase subunit